MASKVASDTRALIAEMLGLPPPSAEHQTTASFAATPASRFASLFQEKSPTLQPSSSPLLETSSTTPTTGKRSLSSGEEESLKKAKTLRDTDVNCFRCKLVGCYGTGRCMFDSNVFYAKKCAQALACGTRARAS